MWLLPTKRRLKQLQDLLWAMMETKISTPGMILVTFQEFSELEEEYKKLHLPKGWRIACTEAEGMAAKVNEAYTFMEKTDWIGVLTDDMWPITPHWDTKLIAGLEGWNIVTGNDLDQAPKRMESATVWSRDLVDAIGYLAPPGMKHLFFDDVWERLNTVTGCIRWMMDVKVAHRPTTYLSSADETGKKIRTFHDHDERVYRDWLHDRFAKACEAILECAQKHGVPVARPDLKGVSLYVATPDGSGELERLYVRALMQTVEMVRTAGGVADWGDLPYCADVSLARDQIIGAFLHSRHTHMLMVDSDMGWSPHDVLRLLMTKLDLVGGAGPKRQYPLKFCIHSRDDQGREVFGKYYEQTNTVEVTAIGTGFLLITRACAERMVQAYPEMAFDLGEGRTQYGLFDSLIVNRTRYSDDFAFCWRWRKIGGQVHVMPSIKLAHVGSHCFEGSLLEAMAAEPEVPLAAE